jgi:hypothetical protein
VVTPNAQNEAPKTALVSTLHDVSGRMLPALRDCAPQLAQYGRVYVCATMVTDRHLRAALGDLGAVVLNGDERVGEGRRAALRAAFDDGHAAFLACDFDRWLHWAGRFPTELAAITLRVPRRRPRPWCACLGRTSRALATHPPVQWLSELATNHALSLAVGQPLDATAGACWLSPEGARLVLDSSLEPTAATDLEWPALIFRSAPDRLIGVATDGLEFETADFFPAEIAAAGGVAVWVRDHYERPEVWLARLRLATDSVAALCRVLSSDGPV